MDNKERERLGWTIVFLVVVLIVAVVIVGAI